MTQCGGCGGEAADCYLCGICTRDLKDLLLSLACGGPSQHPGKEDLPGLLAELESTSVGQSKLSEPVRRSNREPPGLQELAGLTRYRDVYQSDGDDNPIGLYPNDDETDLGRAREQREKAIRRRLLSAGRCNEYAADLAEEIHMCFRRWCVGKGGLAIKHGRLLAPPPSWWRPANEYRFTTIDFTLWLVQAVHLIALDEDAGHFMRSVKGFVHRIKKVIDKPEEPRFLGPCPTPVAHHKACAARLEAPPQATTVTCQQCGSVHEVDQLLKSLLLWLKDERGTAAELHILLRKAGYNLPSGTFKSWVHRRKLVAVGHLRPHGGRGIRKHSDDDRPIYLMSDVLTLMGLAAEEEITA